MIEPAPVIKHVSVTPTVSCSTPAPETDHVTHAPVVEYIAPAQAVFYPSFSNQLPPVCTNEAVNPQISTTTVEASQVQVCVPEIPETPVVE